MNEKMLLILSTIVNNIQNIYMYIFLTTKECTLLIYLELIMENNK